MLTDVTSASAVIALMGPRSREILGGATDADLSDAAFPSFTAQTIAVGRAGCVSARRVSYVGELGWELYAPTDQIHEVYDALFASAGLIEANEGLGEGEVLSPGGYYASRFAPHRKGIPCLGSRFAP